MNTFTEAAQTHWPLIADYVLQATLLLGGILILTFMLKRLSSARKHALLLTGLLGIPVLLLVTTLTPSQWTLPGTGAESRPTTSLKSGRQPMTTTTIPLRVETAISVAHPLSSAPAPAAPNPPAAPASITPASPEPPQLAWPVIIAGIWTAGIAICLLRLGIGWLSLRVATRKLASCEGPEIIAQWNEIQRIHPSFPATLLLQGEQSSMPMTFGSLRPAIVMPGDAKNWNPDRLRRVLLHECAHVARRDCLTNTLALISGCLLWFHPLTWICWRRLRREQESAADDWAIQHTTDPEAYADDLVAIVRDYPRHLPGVGLALSIAMARGTHDLKKRLDLLLDNRRDRSSCGRRMILALASVCLLLVVVLGGLAACRDQPAGAGAKSTSQETRTFTLTEVRQNRLLVQGESDPFAINTSKRPFDSQQSLEKIREEIASLNISASVTNISLPDRKTLIVTGSDSALKRIEEWLMTYDGSIDAQIEIASKIFKLSANSDIDAVLNATMKDEQSATSAATLTDAEGAELFEKLRLDDNIELIQTPTIISRTNQRAKVERIREMIYPTEWDPPQLNERPRPGQPSNVNQLNAEIRRLETLAGLEGERIVEEAGDLGIKNASLLTLYPRRLELKAQLAGIETGKDRNHPEVQAVAAELDEVNQMLDRGVKSAKRAMATQLEILYKTLEQDESDADRSTIIPALPTAFETRNAGTTFTFLPRVLADGRIDLEFELEHVRFLGFFDYGPAIQSGANAPIESKIQQPIFETSKCSSTTSIESGSWIVVTGLGAKGTSGTPELNEGATPKFEAPNDVDDSQFLVLIRVSRADTP